MPRRLLLVCMAAAEVESVSALLCDSVAGQIGVVIAARSDCVHVIHTRALVDRALLSSAVAATQQRMLKPTTKHNTDCGGQFESCALPVSNWAVCCVLLRESDVCHALSTMSSVAASTRRS